ncbi:hypothetical protein BJF90_36050 [Pseudonocardia sp. CNS-004]|nr:hypothetical protein BJF90_36050 [Pseudonocardia sp. CNS-004]
MLLPEVVLALFSAPVLRIGVAIIVALVAGRHHDLIVSFSMALGVYHFRRLRAVHLHVADHVTGQPLSICSEWSR